jgi:hypothetical protein
MPAAAEDDGICIDDVISADDYVIGGADDVRQGAAAAAGSLSLTGASGSVTTLEHSKQVVVEEWYEYQRRDVGDTWVPHTPAGTSSSSSFREGVCLPPGWVWSGDWQLQGTAADAAARARDGREGWVYAEQLPSSKESVSVWSDTCSDSNRFRRRRWQRQRIRIAAAASSAAAEAAAGGLAEQNASSLQQQQQQYVEAGGRPSAAGDAAGSRDQGMVLLAVLLCTLLRGSKLQESKRAAIMLLTTAALGCDDEVRLQTVVPYLLTQLSDAHAAVR